jgi:eukaryotic-like serine/threonine-protein kinase
MHDEKWDRIQETFHAALQQPAHERSAYLDSVCGDDLELRREVDSLLQETSQIENFMEEPAAGVSLAHMDLDQAGSLEGHSLKHYEFGALAGSGGMADVYRGRDTRLRRDVAIKVLHHARSMNALSLERLYREAHLLAALNHPNIGAIHGIEEGDAITALVLEWIEGDVLVDRIKRGSISVAEALEIATQLTAGLQAAHARGIIHRDLKPSNIKITPEGVVKIIDFGVAKLIQSMEDDTQQPTSLSSDGLIIGTVAYMSPEQARGKTIDERTDIWAFGCVLYEMLTGKPAFEGASPTDIIVKIATEEPDWNRIPRFSEATSQDLVQVVRKCMQKNPDLRYQSVGEISSDLESLQRTGAVPHAGGSRTAGEDFALPTQSARLVFLLAQFGYLALYGAAMYFIEAIGRILSTDFLVPERGAVIATLILAMWGIATRVYLISAVGLRHPSAGQKFTLLFPVLLLLDGIWAASPLLLWRKLGYGPALIGVALLAYVPFSQRTLIHAMYPRRILK